MEPIDINPDHAPYCDSDGWLLPMDQWPEYQERPDAPADHDLPNANDQPRP